MNADVSVTGKRAPRSSFNGLDAQHAVQGVTLDNLRLNGKLTTTATEANLTVGPHVSDVRFGTAAKWPRRPEQPARRWCRGPRWQILDGLAGKRIWAESAGGGATTNAAPGGLRKLPDAQGELEVRLRVEKFQNGAHGRWRAL